VSKRKDSRYVSAPSPYWLKMKNPESVAARRKPKRSGLLAELIENENRLLRAKYLGALADRLFRDECVRLGLDANEAIKSPLLSIITRQFGAVMPRTQR
jgi:hypothetical protein